MKEEPKAGFFRDEETEINPDLTVKPTLCVPAEKTMIQGKRFFAR